MSCGSRKTPAQEEKRPAEELSSQAPAANPPVTGDERPVIVAFGDSLTAGVAGRSYPDQLQDLLDQHGMKFRVENQGISGDTSTDGLARIDNLIAAKPVLVLLEFGGNDGLRGIPVDATKKNLKEIIERLRAASIPIVLLGITLPPNYGPEYVRPFTAMFPELAGQFHLRYLPFLLVHVYQNANLMQPDGIHPNGEGNKIVAQDVFELIKPILMRSSKRAALPGEAGPKSLRHSKQSTASVKRDETNFLLPTLSCHKVRSFAVNG
jgi:acyl-CoA thioesterase I